MNELGIVEINGDKSGMKNIELKDLSHLNGFDKARHRMHDASQNGTGLYTEEPLLEQNLSSTSTLSSKQHVTMKKQVGLLSGVALIVGTMIGKENLLNVFRKTFIRI